MHQHEKKLHSLLLCAVNSVCRLTLAQQKWKWPEALFMGLGKVGKAFVVGAYCPAHRSCRWEVSCLLTSVSRLVCGCRRVRSSCLSGAGTPPVDSQDPAMISRNPTMIAALSGSPSKVTPRRTETAGLT